MQLLSRRYIFHLKKHRPRCALRKSDACNMRLPKISLCLVFYHVAQSTENVSKCASFINIRRCMIRSERLTLLCLCTSAPKTRNLTSNVRSVHNDVELTYLQLVKLLKFPRFRNDLREKESIPWLFCVGRPFSLKYFFRELLLKEILYSLYKFHKYRIKITTICVMLINFRRKKETKKKKTIPGFWADLFFQTSTKIHGS